MATKATKAAKAVKAVETKTAKTAEAVAAKRGRAGQFDGKRIRKNVKDWPGRAGTLIAASFGLIVNGMTYQAYVNAGGRYIDLVDAIKQGHVTVE